MSFISGYEGYISLIVMFIFILLAYKLLTAYGLKFPSKNLQFKLIEVKKGNMILFRPLVKRYFWGWTPFKIKQDGKTIIADKVQFHNKEAAERYIEFYKKIKGVK
jgi:hypothetical protein